MATDLYINSVLVDRSAARVILHELTLGMDQAETLEFSQLVEPAGTGDYSEGDTVAIDVDSVPTFLGYLARAVPINIGTGSIAVGYLALGLRYLANNIFVTGSDGTGFMQFNLSPTDPGYLSTNSGLDVGHILTQVLDQHAVQLAAIGITSFDPAELAALTVVPPEPVTIAGRLWDSMADLLCQWLPNHAIWADAAGAIHIEDTAALPPLTLTLDEDPVILDRITKDHSECFTRCIMRGRGDIQGAYLSVHEHTLSYPQTDDEEDSWTITDFFQPKGAFDAGVILGQTSDTLLIQSDDPTAHWAANYWNDIGAFVWPFNPIATGITFTEQAAITATTAMSAGGTSTITVGLPFDNVGYTRYQIRGNRTTQSLVWRKMDIVPDFVAFHVARHLNHSVPWSPVDGQVVQTLTPQGVVCWSSSGLPPFNEFPWPFELVLSDGVSRGYIIFLQPLPMAYSSQATLQTGGDAIVPPGDVKVLIPYSRGALEAIVPSSGFEGTAFTEDGVERTLYKDVPEWINGSDRTLMAQLGQQILNSRKDTVYEGCISYLGKLTSVLTLGQSLNIARAGGITGWEGIAAAIRSVSLCWPQSGAAIWETKLQFTTRRRPFTGDRLYVHPGYGAQASLSGGGFNPFGLTVQGMRAITQARQEQFEQDYLSTAGAYEGFETGMDFGPEQKNTYQHNHMTQSEIMRAAQRKNISQREAEHSGMTEAEKMRAAQKFERGRREREKQHGATAKERARQEHLAGRGEKGDEMPADPFDRPDIPENPMAD